MPAPDGDALLVSSGSGGSVGEVAAPGRAPLGSDDADMEGDAVMLEYDVAEQLVSLSRLSLEDPAPQEGAQAVAAEGADGEQQDQQAGAGEGAAVAAAAAEEPPPQEGEGEGPAAAPLKGEIAAEALQASSPPPAPVATS